MSVQSKDLMDTRKKGLFAFLIGHECNLLHALSWIPQAVVRNFLMDHLSNYLLAEENLTSASDRFELDLTSRCLGISVIVSGGRGATTDNLF